MSSQGKTILASARQQQQYWYEMLPEWTVYEPSEYDYLKLKISMAIFGMPEGKLDSNLDLRKCMKYTPAQRNLINTVYDQICTWGKGYRNEGSICYSLVYNVFFSSKSKNAVPNTETKTHMTPIFKIQKKMRQTSAQDFGDILTTWYIDIYGRVYKSWKSYKSDNNLPPCIMVLPKDGSYQPDTSYFVSRDTSTVWLEVVDSPASDTIATICEVADTTSTITTTVGMGIAIASMFTGVGAIIGGIGLVATGVGGLWTAGRSIQQLVDRSMHEESINVTNKDALGAWIGISGSALGIASTTGVALIAKSARAGNSISTLAKITSNTAMGGCLAVNGAGVLFLGYSMYDKYINGETITVFDVVLFVGHVFFFSNAVVRVQFAGDLIRSSRGSIIEQFKADIRSKNMLKAFNRVMQNTGSEVVKFALAKQESLFTQNPGQASLTSASPSTAVLTFENGQIVVNNVILLDPIQFAWSIGTHNAAYRISNQRDVVNDVAYKSKVFLSLKEQLQQLLMNFCSAITKVRSWEIVQDSIDILKEIWRTDKPEDVLNMFVDIAVKLLSGAPPDAVLIGLALRFIYLYVMRHLEKRIGHKNREMYDILKAILQAGDYFTHLRQAFHVYNLN